MRELYIEGVATHGGPESCVGVREGVNALTASLRTLKLSGMLQTLDARLGAQARAGELGHLKFL